MANDDLDLSLDLDVSLDQTLRLDAPAIPLEAMLVDEDTPTLELVPSALEALAARSIVTNPVGRPRASRADEEAALRRAVYGIWAVAAVLFVTLGILVR